MAQMRAFKRHVASFAAAFAVAAVMVAGGAPATNAQLPTIYVMYAMNCTFQIVNDQGQQITSIAPGTYQVDVRTPLAFGTVPLANMGVTDMTACKGFPQFQLTGPGVNLFTTMTAGCEADKTYPETFAPSATYVATDQNQPTVARGTFTTLASGTPQTSTTPGTPWAGGTQSSQDLVGSGAILGTMQGTLATNGALKLTLSGKAVSKVPMGRYTFAVVDKSPKTGFVIIGPKGTLPTDVTGSRFVGKKTKTLKLTPGRWTYYSSGMRDVHYIDVTNAST
jgi:hypothetical protein